MSWTFLQRADGYITTDYPASTKNGEKCFKTVIVVSDCAEMDENIADASDHGLDRTPAAHSTALAAAIEKAGFDVAMYSDLPRFVADAARFPSALVFPNWSGSRSRNRTSLVVAICEAAGLDYVGADAYVRTIFFDKAWGKQVCRTFGFSVPDGVTLATVEDAATTQLPPAPWVCKPMMEGSSIGIASSDPIVEAERVRDEAAGLLAAFDQPALVEAFVPGREVAICLTGRGTGEPDVRVGEWVVPEQPDFFFTGLCSAQVKVGLRAPEHLRDITSSFPRQDIQRAVRMFKVLGKVDFMRVDGRLTRDGRFVVIEVTVDINFAPTGEFAGLPMLAGASYEEVVATWLAAAG